MRILQTRATTFRNWNGIYPNVRIALNKEFTRMQPDWLSLFIVYLLILFHCNLGYVFLSFDWIKTIIIIIIKQNNTVNRRNYT